MLSVTILTALDIICTKHDFLGTRVIESILNVGRTRLHGHKQGGHFLEERGFFVYLKILEAYPEILLATSKKLLFYTCHTNSEWITMLFQHPISIIFVQEDLH